MINLQNITGGRQLQELLNQLPAKLEQNVMRSALAAGAKVIMLQAKANAPVAPPNSKNKARYGGYAGALRDSIRVTREKTKSGRVLVSVKAGRTSGKKRHKNDVYYAHFVEFGTAAHWVKVNKKVRPERGRKKFSIGTINKMAARGSLVIGRNFVGESIAHPGARARPFMRPAFDARHGDAIVAVGAHIAKRLTKAGINVPDDAGLEAE